jgi:hypothetical protein
MVDIKVNHPFIAMENRWAILPQWMIYLNILNGSINKWFIEPKGPFPSSRTVKIT